MRPKIPDRQTFTFRLDQIAYDKSKIIARTQDRPLNGQLEYWIKKAVEQYEKENGTISLPTEQ
jgi:hypothetical protein